VPLLQAFYADYLLSVVMLIVVMLSVVTPGSAGLTNLTTNRVLKSFIIVGSTSKSTSTFGFSF
jgi:hypothetical protein